MIGDSDLNFMTKPDLIGLLWVRYAFPRNPILQFDAPGR